MSDVGIDDLPDNLQELEEWRRTEAAAIRKAARKQLDHVTRTYRKKRDEFRREAPGGDPA